MPRHDPSEVNGQLFLPLIIYLFIGATGRSAIVQYHDYTQQAFHIE